MARDIYREVTDTILAQLEKGVRPWQRPWETGVEAEKPAPTLPLRHNGEPYRGTNVVLLWSAASERGYDKPTWMTYRQAQELGGNVRKGEKGVLVTFARTWTKKEVDPETGIEEEKEVPVMKGYTVFNVAQIDGLPQQYYERKSEETSPAARIEGAEAWLQATGVELRHGGDKAYYSPAGDYVQLPSFAAFKEPLGYYATAMHEITHWTRHPDRLDRNFGQKRFGDNGYAMEELTAELGSAFVGAETGVAPEVREDHAAYIGAWMAVMKDDKKAFFTAASHAAKAAEFLSELTEGYRRTETLEETREETAEVRTAPSVAAEPALPVQGELFRGVSARALIDPGDIVRGDLIRWTEEVRAGPWPSVAGRRTVEAAVEDIVLDAAGAGEDAIGLVVRNSEGANALEAGDRICRSGGDLFEARCERSAGKEGTERQAALEERNAERAEAAQPALGRSYGISA